MTEPTKEIEQLFPQGKDVTLKGKKYVIKPFGFGKFPRVLKLLKGINEVGPQGAVSSNEIMSFIMDNSDIVIEFSMLATGESREFFEDVPLDEAVDLLQSIIEVNADFFVKRLQPKVMGALAKLTESVGGMLSQDSSLPATV